MLEHLALTTHRAFAPRFTAEPAGQAIEHRPIGLAEGLPGTVHGLLEKHIVFGRAATGADIGAVHREVHDQFLQRPTDRAEGQVAGHQVVPGHLQQGLGDTFEITGQRAVEDLLTRQLRFLTEIGGPFAVATPEFAQGLGAFGIVLQQRQLVHEFVTGGAIHRPVAVQGFAFAEDLLDVDRQVPVRRQAIDPAPQFAAVTARVGEAVDVVDAQTVDQAFGHQLEDFRVGRFEHRRPFDPQAAQFVDIEKTPPVDVIRRRAPTGQAIALALQQVVQALETLGRQRVVSAQVAVGWLAATPDRWPVRAALLSAVSPGCARRSGSSRC